MDSSSNINHNLAICLMQYLHISNTFSHHNTSSNMYISSSTLICLSTFICSSRTSPQKCHKVYHTNRFRMTNTKFIYNKQENLLKKRKIYSTMYILYHYINSLAHIYISKHAQYPNTTIPIHLPDTQIHIQTHSSLFSVPSLHITPVSQHSSLSTFNLQSTSSTHTARSTHPHIAYLLFMAHSTDFQPQTSDSSLHSKYNK